MSELPARVIAAATTRGIGLAVAESLTGGAVLSALVSVPGASVVLRGGIVAYATELKHTLLDVPAGLLAARGPVDPEVAEAMALGVLHRTGARLAVATTGVAGPDAQGGKSVGLVYVGLASAGSAAGGVAPADAETSGAWVASSEHVFDGDRASIRAAAVEAALTALLTALERS